MTRDDIEMVGTAGRELLVFGRKMLGRRVQIARV